MGEDGKSSDGGEREIQMARLKLLLPPEGVLQPNDVYDDPLHFYYRPVVGALYRRRIESGLSLLRPPYARILEIGYGSGLLMPTLVTLAPHVAGVDLASDPQATGKILRGLGIEAELHKGDIASFSAGEERFDLIVAFSIFEHVADPSTALAACARLLQPDGQLLIGMPRVDRLMVPLFDLIGYHGINEHHVTTYRQVVRAAHNQFILRRFRCFPHGLPRWAGLYFNLLFQKKPER